MKQKLCVPIAIGIIMSGFVSGCYQDKSVSDPTVLKRVFESYFIGIETKDYKKLTDAVTDDFVLYEMGRVWNNDSVIVNIKRNLPFQVRYTFTNHKIHVDQLSGDITCFNHGDFLFGDSTTQSFDWIESATFRMVDGKWRMNFLHITEKHKTGEQ